MNTPHYDLTLFVNGASGLSARAIADARALCDARLGGRYDLAIVDIHEDPGAALRSQVLAAPTLVKNQPLPVRRIVGDLSDPTKVHLALELV
jgi:circadian clock protein KaiB